MTVRECAEVLETSQQTIRIGLQRGIFGFGYAVKTSSQYTYIISRELVNAYIGGKHG